MHIPISRLDPQSLAYLQSIERVQGANTAGVFIPQLLPGGIEAPPPRLIAQSENRFLYLIAGIICLIVSGTLFIPSILATLIQEPSDIQTYSIAQAATLGLGVFLISIALLRAQQNQQPPPAKFRSSFIYVDALHLWFVTPNFVRVLPISTMTEIAGDHYPPNDPSRYDYTQIELIFGEYRESLRLVDKERSEFLYQFLSMLLYCRTTKKEPFASEMRTLSPADIGRVAFHLATQGEPVDIRLLPPGLPFLPYPQEVAETREEVRSRPPILAPILGVFVAVAGYAVFPSVNRESAQIGLRNVVFTSDAETAQEAADRYRLLFPDKPDQIQEVRNRADSLLFEKVPFDYPGNFEALEAYLARYPKDGRHTAEALDRQERWRAELIAKLPTERFVEEFPKFLSRYPNSKHAAKIIEREDEFMYELVKNELKERITPAKYRIYLNEPRRVRHREEMLKGLDKIYEDAIFDIERVVRDPQRRQLLREGFLLLLRSKAVRLSGRVHVYFEKAEEPVPTSSELKKKEDEHYKMLLGKREVATLAKESLTGSALIDPTPAFQADQSVVRQKAFLAAFRQAILSIRDDSGASILAAGSKLLDIEEIDSPGLANVVVRYRIYATGDLTEYRRDNTLVGIYRCYAIEWSVSIRESDGREPYIWKYATPPEPVIDRIYRYENGDEKWKAYATILYHAFLDCARNWLATIGLIPPPVFTPIPYRSVRVQ